MYIAVIDNQISGFDDCYYSPSRAYTLHLTNDSLGIGDWAKGPAGTGENKFTVSEYSPSSEIGCLAESFEFPDPYTIIIRLKKGIHFAVNPNSEASRLVGGRELTANDVAYSIKRSCTAKQGGLAKGYPYWFQSVETPDKYTVVVHGQDNPVTPGAYWFQYMTVVHIVPPEVVEKYGDMRDWRVSVGTGPFMLVDHVSASSSTMVRNPNYWETDPIGPGKGNQLPYLDSVKYLDIRDKSTRFAALRTSRIDWVEEVPWEDAEEILKISPWLKWGTGLRESHVIWFRLDKPGKPWNDNSVRQALHMGINLKAIKDEFYDGKAEILSIPVAPHASRVYTPVEKLPAEIRELFEYNPEKAKKLLVEAGYPNGFKAEVLCYEDFLDELSIVKDDWSKLGVDLTFNVKEYATFMSIRAGKKHEELIAYERSLGYTYKPIDYRPPPIDQNLFMLNDEYFNERYKQLGSWEIQGNVEKIDKLIKEIALHVLGQVYGIQLPTPFVYTLWAPWVKNYHGERPLGYLHYFMHVKYIWYDQDLKKQMTGRG